MALAVAPRPIGVPAREERGLLTYIREVSAHLGAQVQESEYAEVGLMPRVEYLFAGETMGLSPASGWPQGC